MRLDFFSKRNTRNFLFFTFFTSRREISPQAYKGHDGLFKGFIPLMKMLSEKKAQALKVDS